MPAVKIYVKDSILARRRIAAVRKKWSRFARLIFEGTIPIFREGIIRHFQHEGRVPVDIATGVADRRGPWQRLGRLGKRLREYRGIPAMNPLLQGTGRLLTAIIQMKIDYKPGVGLVFRLPRTPKYAIGHDEGLSMPVKGGRKIKGNRKVPPRPLIRVEPQTIAAIRKFIEVDVFDWIIGGRNEATVGFDAQLL